MCSVYWQNCLTFLTLMFIQVCDQGVTVRPELTLCNICTLYFEHFGTVPNEKIKCYGHAWVSNFCVLNHSPLNAALRYTACNTHCYWRNWGGQDIESPVQCVAIVKIGESTRPPIGQRCRKWAAASQIWQEVLNAHWDGVCVRVCKSPSSHNSWWLPEETYEA